MHSINPKILLIGEKLRFRSFQGANKALPILASCLHNHGFNHVVQLDLERPTLSFNNVLAESADADLIAFAGCMTPQWAYLDDSVRRLGSHLHRIQRAQVPIVIGGYAAKNAEDIARFMPMVSGLFNGEGESGIVQICDTVAHGTFAQERKHITGLCYLDEHGHYHQSLANRTRNLDKINQNFGFSHISSVHDMDIFVHNGRMLKTAQLFTQRGCPWACGYCNKSTEGNKVVRLSESAIRDQLRLLRSEGYEAVYLDVDTFTVDVKAARREAEIIKEEGFVWGSNTRIDRIDLNLMNHFVQNNCRYMFFGVEHIQPEVLLAIDKFNGLQEHRIQQAMTYRQTVKRIFTEMSLAGLPSSYFIILGLPKTVLGSDQKTPVDFVPATLEDDLEAVRFGIEECKPDFLNFNLLRFMPGSVAADAGPHSAFVCVRPSGVDPVTAGYFHPRVSAARGYRLPEYHGVYRLFESIAPGQPISTAIDPERAYRTFKAAVDIINRQVDIGGKATTLFLDQEVAHLGLVKRDERGHYTLAPLKEFDQLTRV